MILRTYHISVIAVFLVFTNARTIQSTSQSEADQNQNLLGPSFRWVKVFDSDGSLKNPFFPQMQFNPYAQYHFPNPFHNPHSVYMPPAESPMTDTEYMDSLYKELMAETTPKKNKPGK